nr:retrovirus-related Pol polyprotein from transposon TNT 1-94 [Tanacetum cinerariifolium]
MQDDEEFKRGWLGIKCVGDKIFVSSQRGKLYSFDKVSQQACWSREIDTLPPFSNARYMVDPSFIIMYSYSVTEQACWSREIDILPPFSNARYMVDPSFIIMYSDSVTKVLRMFSDRIHEAWSSSRPPTQARQGNKNLSELYEGIITNIDACKELSTVTRTSLGPNELGSIHNHLDDTFLSRYQALQYAADAICDDLSVFQGLCCLVIVMVYHKVYQINKRIKMTGAKFDIEKFNETGDFKLWRVKMHVLPIDMKVEAKAELNKKAHSVMILCLSNKVLREVIKETTTTGVWTKLDTEEEVVYILHIKFEDEDLALLLLTSLPASYEHFVDTLEALTLEDLREKLRSKPRGGRLKCYVCQSKDHLKRNCPKNNCKKSTSYVKKDDQPISSGSVDDGSEPSPQSGRAETIADRVHSRAVAAVVSETQPKMLPGTTMVMVEEITNTKGPVPIQFELRNKQTIIPLGDHAAHWSSYIGEVIRGVPLYYPSRFKVLKERKVALITDIQTQFDLKPHMEFPASTEINVGIQQHLQKAYNTNKATFKARHWVTDPTIGTYNVEKISLARPENITASECGISILCFGMIPGTLPEPLKISKTRKRARSYLDADPGRLLAFEMRWSTRRSLTPSSWHTLLTRNSFGMRTDVYTVLSARATASPSTPAHDKKVDLIMRLFKTASKYSDMFSQFEREWRVHGRRGGCRPSGRNEDEDGDGDT